MVGSAARVLACARAVTPSHPPRRTAKGRRAGCPGGWDGIRVAIRRRGTRESDPPTRAGVAESAIYAWEVGGRAQLRTPPPTSVGVLAPQAMCPPAAG